MKGLIYFVLFAAFSVGMELLILEGEWKYAFVCFLIAELFLVLLIFHLKVRV